MSINLSKKKVTVVGLGRSGLSAALLLEQLNAEVKVTDCGDNEELRSNARLLKSRGIAVELGRHSQGFVTGSDLVVLSPGVKTDSPLIVWADKKGVPVIGEIELAYQYCPAPIVAVTGTNGKTTVATLIGEILSNAKREVVVCGNIGQSFSKQISKIKPRHTVVLEISSFQLERIVKFRPYIAVFLNISEDHLDRHQNFDQYFRTKTLIFANQKESDWAVLNCQDPNLKKLGSKLKSKVRFFAEDKLNPNRSAALAVGDILGIDQKAIRETIDNFRGLEHRMEYVNSIEGVRFINDSKATNISSTIWALQQLSEPIILIAGGREKETNFESIVGLIARKVKAVVLIGEAKQKINKALANRVLTQEADSLKEAMRLAKQMAVEGDTVLLSPMCASFDMFKNFEERGKLFKEICSELEFQYS